MKNAKKLLALFLALVMIASTLAACGGDDKSDPTEAAKAADTKAEKTITASAVKFSKTGAYTTTVRSDTVDLSGVSADKIEVLYYNPTAPETLEVATVDEADSEVKIEFSKAEITGAKKNDDGSWTIAFTDPDAAEYATDCYEVVFTELDNSAAVDVQFPEITLKQDLEFVTPADHKIKVALTIEGSEFTDGVTADDLTLGVAFTGMEAEVISSSAKNLTVELTGDLKKSVANTYQCGAVSVSPKVIKDGYADVTAEVPVRLESAGFDASTLKYADGKITGDFKIYGVADVDTLTKDNVKFADATVEAVEKVDDNTIKLTLSAEGVNSVNRFAGLMVDSELTLGDYVTTLDLCQASFYPVYDFVEQDGDKLKLTLKLYASTGTFAEDFNKDMITYDDGFADAETVSLTLDSERLATLILSIPANGMTDETLDVDGTITLAEGALTNLWGDAAYETGSTRNYNAENMGKGLFSKLWDKIKDGASYVWDKMKDGASKAYDYYKEGLGYFKKGLGYISDFLGFDITGGMFGNGNADVLKASKQILADLGAVKSDLQTIKSELGEMKVTMHNVLSNQYTIMLQLEELESTVVEASNDTYRDNLDELESYIERIAMTYKLGALYMALEDAVADGKLASMPVITDIATAEKDYAKYLPDTANMTDQQAAAYNDRIVDYIYARGRNDGDTEFNTFKTNYIQLKSLLTKVGNKLKRTDGTNPLTRYDNLCALKYNFDSQCFDFRASTRLTALFLMAEAMELVTVCEKAPSGKISSDYTTLNKIVDDAMIQINLMPIGHPAEEIKAYPHTESIPVSQTGKYISEIALAGGSTQSEALNALIDEGYTPLNINLNENNWVYMGYKTTNDRSKAIKHLDYFSADNRYIDRDQLGQETITLYGQYTFTRTKCLGSDEFKATNGDLNYGRYYPCYLYYSTDLDNNYQLTDITHTRFPGEVGYSWEDSGSRSIDREYDEEYYPYSYVLKKKVCIRESEGYGSCTYSRWGAAVLDGKSNYNGFNWTDVQLNSFFGRMGGRTLQQEFASAGIKINNALLVNYSVGQSCGKWLYNMRLLNANATNFNSAYNKTEQEKKDTYASTDTKFFLIEFFDAY